MSKHQEHQAVLDKLLDCLNDLDSMEADIAAAHLSLAIEHYKIQFDLDEDTSNSV